MPNNLLLISKRLFGIQPFCTQKRFYGVAPENSRFSSFLSSKVSIFRGRPGSSILLIFRHFCRFWHSFPIAIPPPPTPMFENAKSLDFDSFFAFLEHWSWGGGKVVGPKKLALGAQGQLFWASQFSWARLFGPEWETRIRGEFEQNGPK